MLDALGAIIGKLLAGGDEAQGRQYQQDALNQYLNEAGPSYDRINAPTVGAMSPVTRNAMLQALDNYQAVGKSGYTPQDRAELLGAQRDISDSARGNQEALMQRADAQGGLGGGNALMAQLVSEQGQADRANRTGNQIAIAGRQRALDAYGRSADLAGSIQNRDDAIAQFNARNSMAAQQYNSELGRAQWQDQNQLASERAGAYQTAGGQAYDRANQTVGLGAGVGQGLDQAATAVAGMGGFGQGAQDFVNGRSGAGGYGYGNGYGNGGGYGYQRPPPGGLYGL